MTTASGHSGGLVDAILRMLGRVTTSGRFIPEVDGLRFIAIISVVLAHISSALEPTPDPSTLGPIGRALMVSYHSGVMGVYLFFGISGFILALPFAESSLGGGRRVRLGPYYARRVMRIEPPYIINMTLLFALMLLAHGSARFHLFPNYLASLFYVHNLTYGVWSAINFVAWSLEIEVQFYLIAPVLALVYRIAPRALRRAAIAGLMIAPIAFALVFPGASDVLHATILVHVQYFLAGFLMADIYLVDWAERPERSWAWDVVASVALVGVFASAYWRDLRAISPFLILVGFCGAFRGRALGVALSNRWVATIGGMCYTVYLYHFWVGRAVFGVLDRLFPGLSVPSRLILHAAVGIPPVLAICSVLFILTEKPFMYRDWPARFSASISRLASRFSPRAGRPTAVDDPNRR